MRDTPPCARMSDAFERHDGYRSGVLGDLGMLDIDDVHDDAALEHLGEPGLDPERAGLLLCVSHVRLLLSASAAILGHACRISGCVQT
jgi:hypothetical protein